MTSSDSGQLRSLAELRTQVFQEDDRPTQSSTEQLAVEKSCLAAYEFYHKGQPVLNTKMTVKFLLRGLKNLSEGYECLDASRPWICYWILHALKLLGEAVDGGTADDVADFLGRCQNPEGGF